MRSRDELTDDDYARLLELRVGLRRFLHWSEEQAKSRDLTPAQHQLLLCVRGHRDPRGPSIGQVADYLVLRHHSAVGLIDRAEAAGLVRREPDRAHPGTVRVTLTGLGEQRIGELAALHMTELARLAPTMQALWGTVPEHAERDASPDPA